MGHGDEIILADGNFPAESIGKDAIVIRADGHGTVEPLGSRRFLSQWDFRLNHGDGHHYVFLWRD